MASSKRPTEFGPTKRLERAYADGVKQIAKRMLPPKLPEQTVEEWLAEIAARSQRQDVISASEFLARKMYTQVNVKNARTWREAAARSQRSRWLFARLQEEMKGATGDRVRSLVSQNAALIRSVPLKAAETLTNEVLRAQQQGARASTIAKMTRIRFPELLRSRVNLISRTEVSKASSSLTEARCADLELSCYIWQTSQDVRVRDSHRLMNGVLCFWNDPPAPEALAGEKSTLGAYNVGNCPNDRCTPLVVLHIDDISWPRKVHSQGSIHQMTKMAFMSKFAALLKEAA